MASKKILIVEDEKPLSHALSLKLQHEGFTTLVVDNGKAALDALQSEAYDVMLLDMMMPIMDGFQVLQQLAASGKKRPVIFVLSNLSQHEDTDRVMELGVKKYFIKSDTPLSVLVEEIKNA